MDKFTRLTAVAAPLLRINVDTDAIIPSREMKRVSKEGLSEGLFAGWRYLSPGSREENPDFILNREPYRSAQILISGANFGCGSSREHAVWALHEWGIRCVIAPSFGAIFHGNCVRNGILPVVLAEDVVERLVRPALPPDRRSSPAPSPSPTGRYIRSPSRSLIARCCSRLDSIADAETRRAILVRERDWRNGPGSTCPRNRGRNRGQTTISAGTRPVSRVAAELQSDLFQLFGGDGLAAMSASISAAL